MRSSSACVSSLDRVASSSSRPVSTSREFILLSVLLTSMLRSGRIDLRSMALSSWLISLMRFCFISSGVGSGGNPRAHKPKILYTEELEAIEYFMLISMLHKQLDKCIKIK